MALVAERNDRRGGMRIPTVGNAGSCRGGWTSDRVWSGQGRARTQGYMSYLPYTHMGHLRGVVRAVLPDLGWLPMRFGVEPLPLGPARVRKGRAGCQGV
jgi:hypothetical protein